MADFEKKTIEVKGKKYTLQKLPVREAIRLRQRWGSRTTSSGVDDEMLIDLCLENVVVMPKVKMEDFTDIEELEELVMECINFQYLGK